ncbi:MAG: aminopeptidase [Bauldia sp.]|nr:aminopeptidase [Bauldia sp.]
MPIRVARIAALLLLAGATLAGCASAGYYAQSIQGHLALMGAREDVGRLIRDEDTPDALRSRLILAEEIRTFAIEALALPDNGSYRTYADIGREVVTWNVVATPPLSLDPVAWCFPVFGCVAYRGYFAEEDAIAFARTLVAEGLDVTIGGSIAYSTLGWFRDPLLNTMIFDPDYALAGTIFHELAHQRLYANDDSMFNESYAVAVEREGMRRWLAAHGTPELVAAYRASEQRREDFVTLVLGARDRLEALYASDRSDAEKLRRKAAIFDQLRADYRVLRAAWGGYAGYDRWFAQDLNNANLASIATYNATVPAFEALLASVGGDMAAFHAAAEALGRLTRAERDAALARLAEGAG